MSTHRTGLSFIFILSITLLIYWQGTTGIYLLDDYGVLPDIPKYDYLGTWRHFLLFLLEGDTGPTGRPISLATFFFNSQTWPASPWAFKVTNIVIHLFNGILLLWFVTKLTNTIDLKINHIHWLVLLTVGYWLLHPLQVTTVLYIVQRMTELSTLFMILGLVAYLYGRDLVAKKSNFRSYFLLSAGIGINLVLAILSKETGVLLIGYIFVLEYFLLRPYGITTPNKFNIWFGLIIFLPLTLLILYIFSVGLNSNAYLLRDFTLEERLLTQSRIIFNYLFNILLPGLQTPTLFYDDFILSKNIIAPWTTLTSLLGIIALLILSIILRKKYSLLSFSIAWFFIGHILESTVIPLELYFEHRNYLPLLGPLFALVYYSIKVLEQYKHLDKTIIIMGVAFTLLLVGSTLSNTVIWGKPVALIVGWSQEHPKSIRAAEVLEALEIDMGFEIKDPELKARIQHLYTKESARSSYTLLRDLKYSCSEGKLTQEKLDTSLENLQHSIYESSTANTFNSFFLDWLEGRCTTISPKSMVIFIDKLLAIKQLQHGLMPHISQYNLSRLWKKERNLGKTLLHLKESYYLNPELGSLLLQADYLSSAGYHKEALKLLDDTSLLDTSFRKHLILSLRQPEIDRMIERIKTNQRKAL